MKIKFTILFVILFISIDIMLLLKTIHYKEVIKSSNDINLVAYNTINDLKNESINRNSLRFKFEQRTFILNPTIADTLLNLIGNHSKLFFMFGPGSCDACINEALLDIKAFSKRINSDEIIILCQYDNPQDMKILANDVFPIRTLNLKDINLLVQDENLEYLPPSFFVMDIDLIPRNYFMYSTIIPSLNETFFNFTEHYLNDYQ